MINRIGSSCWYRITDQWKAGRLLAWSTDHEGTEFGPAHFPVGVIEDEKTNRCISIPVSQISFAAIP